MLFPPVFYLLPWNPCWRRSHQNQPNETEWPCWMAKRIEESEACLINIGDLWLPLSLYPRICRYHSMPKWPIRKERFIRMDTKAYRCSRTTQGDCMKWTGPTKTKLWESLLFGSWCIAICDRSYSYAEGWTRKTSTCGKHLTFPHTHRKKLRCPRQRTLGSYTRTMSMATHLFIFTTLNNNFYQPHEPSVLPTSIATQPSCCMNTRRASQLPLLSGA